MSDQSSVPMAVTPANQAKDGAAKSAPVPAAPAAPRPAAPTKRKPPGSWPKWLLVPVVIAAAVAGYFVWKYFQPPGLPAGFASSNGRIEATEVDIATKIPGRI